MSDWRKTFPITCPFFKKVFAEDTDYSHIAIYCRKCPLEKRTMCWRCEKEGKFDDVYENFVFTYCQWCPKEVECVLGGIKADIRKI